MLAFACISILYSIFGSWCLIIIQLMPYKWQPVGTLTTVAGSTTALRGSSSTCTRPSTTIVRRWRQADRSLALSSRKIWKNGRISYDFRARWCVADCGTPTVESKFSTWTRSNRNRSASDGRWMTTFFANTSSPVNFRASKDDVDDEIPTTVTFFVHPANESPAAFVPIKRPEKPDNTLDFAICVHVAYNHVEPLRLIEWLEMQRLLGVSKVGVYDFNLDKTSVDLLRHYVAEGLVELHKSNYILDGKELVCIRPIAVCWPRPESFWFILIVLRVYGLLDLRVLENYYPVHCFFLNRKRSGFRWWWQI